MDTCLGGGVFFLPKIAWEVEIFGSKSVGSSRFNGFPLFFEETDMRCFFQHLAC